HQKSAMLGMPTADGKEPLQFGGTVNLRTKDGLASERQRLPQRLDLAMQHPFVEETTGIDGLVDGTGRELAFGGQMKQILTHLFIGKLVGRLTIELGQLIDLLDVSFLSPLSAAAQDQFLDELLA